MRSLLALMLALMLCGCGTIPSKQPTVSICQFTDLAPCTKLIPAPTSKTVDIWDTHAKNVQLWYECAKKFDKLANEARICINVPLK